MRLEHLLKSWALWLTLQDRQKHQPLVAVHGQSRSPEARLLSRLMADFKPFRAPALGSLYALYRRGP